MTGYENSRIALRSSVGQRRAILPSRSAKARTRATQLNVALVRNLYRYVRAGRSLALTKGSASGFHYAAEAHHPGSAAQLPQSPSLADWGTPLSLFNFG
jgi:hypothetical protein